MLFLPLWTGFQILKYEKCAQCHVPVSELRRWSPKTNAERLRHDFHFDKIHFPSFLHTNGNDLTHLIMIS